MYSIQKWLIIDPNSFVSTEENEAHLRTFNYLLDTNSTVSSKLAYSTIKSESIIDCAAICASEPSCWTFNYIPGTKSCVQKCFIEKTDASAENFIFVD